MQRWSCWHCGKGKEVQPADGALVLSSRRSQHSRPCSIMRWQAEETYWEVLDEDVLCWQARSPPHPPPQRRLTGGLPDPSPSALR